MKKNIFFPLAFLIALATPTGCVRYNNDHSETAVKETYESNVSALSPADTEILMNQVAEREIQKRYKKYVPDKAFARAEIFGIDRIGDKGSAYVYLNTAEFVIFKGKAYEMSGSSGEAIIRFIYTENGPQLTKIDWSEDGGGHDAWIKKNFPETFLKKWSAYDAHDKNGTNKIGTAIGKEVEKTLGVPVETENLLEIDTDNETFKIIKTIDTLPLGRFDVKTIDRGKLKKREK